MGKKTVLAILLFIAMTGLFNGFHETVFAVDICGSCPCDPLHPQISTALGCIPTDTSGFIRTFFTIGIGIGGGVAFLLVLIGGFQVLTSSGNPEQLNAGKELVTSAITGLLIIIFSVFILQFIGVTIFQIPGFTK